MPRVLRLIVAIALALLPALPAGAQIKDRLVVGMALEPPHLDPTAGAAAAIDEIGYANIFEGLTRIGPAGEVLPDRDCVLAWSPRSDAGAAAGEFYLPGYCLPSQTKPPMLQTLGIAMKIQRPVSREPSSETPRLVSPSPIFYAPRIPVQAWAGWEVQLAKTPRGPPI